MDIVFMMALEEAKKKVFSVFTMAMVVEQQ
jgi:hypothetical protein